MNNDQLEDLKQFITATVSQQTADHATRNDVKHLTDSINKTDIKLNNALELLETLEQKIA